MRLLILAGIGALAVGVALSTIRPQAQESVEEESEESDKNGVSESELQLYISIYGAMQADHSLTLEDALIPHQMSVEQFRDVERRVQRQQGLVDRVRQALLEQAKDRSAPPSPPGTARPPEKEETP
jgi:hypothetical protein